VGSPRGLVIMKDVPARTCKKLTYPHSNFAVRLVVGAFVPIVLAAALWAASTLAKNNAAVPTPTDAIYRAQYLNLF
jgi:hypothetical protein